MSSDNVSSDVDGILSCIGECVYEWDIGSDALSWNAGAAELLNIRDAEMMGTGRAFNRLLLSTTESSRDDVILSSSETDPGTGVPYSLRYAFSGDMLQTHDDVWVEDSGRWYSGSDGKPGRAIGVVRIVSERRQVEERLARFDPLTGLFNRAHLNMCLDACFDDAVRTGQAASFILVGLEHFELINSVYGFDCGDTVMVEVARRLKENLRDVDIVGRFSGSKIGIVLPECDSKGLLIAGHRILNLLRQNTVITEGGAIATTVFMGGVTFPQHASDSRKVMTAACQALNESRTAKDSRIVSYRHDPRRDAEKLEAARMAEQIVSALKDGRVHLAWQPVVRAATQEVAFHEALIRLEQADGTILSAGEFVAVAESLGLVRLVDHYALDHALDVLQKCPQARLSLNVSYDTANDPEWLSKLAHVIYSDTGLADRLIVEITESHAAESLGEAKRFVESVKDLGCKVALDDFGAGFTSFRNLKSLPFDIIKVDGYFANQLADNPENQGFIKALIDLSNLFDAETVVEWVEDDDTAKTLLQWGVDYLQGYRFGEPQRTLPWAHSPESVSGEDKTSAAAAG